MDHPHPHSAARVTVRRLPAGVEAALSRLRLHWLVDARLSASVGHTAADRRRLLRFHLKTMLADRLGRPAPGPVTAALAPDGHRMSIGQAGELSVMHDILISEEYAWPEPARVVFDLGANIGFATLYFHRCHPGARIVSVEADPGTHARLVDNVGHLPGVTVLHRAAASADGTLTLYASPSSIGSSLCAGFVGEAGEPHEVPASSLGTLMAEQGVEHIDLLKVDIEGAEFDFLRSAPLERVAAIIAEIHYDLVAEGDDEATLRDLLDGFDLRFEPLPQPRRFLLYARRVAAPAGGRKDLAERPVVRGSATH